MGVVLDSGRNAEYTIGLIACSRHQSGSYMPWAPHKPKIDFEVALKLATRGPAMEYLRDQLGYGSTRWSRMPTWNPIDSEQFTGHTAVMVRKAGKVDWASGWVPKFTPMNYLYSLLLGGSAPGEWQDDRGMIQDPTCISYEIIVKRPELCDEFLAYWEKVSRQFESYSFNVRSSRGCNCVWAAVSILKEFASGHQAQLPGVVEGLSKVTGPSQGQLMTLIQSGALLLYDQPPLRARL